MRKTVTIQDVAREAGTSVSTVSRVLTGSAPVSADRRQSVEAAIAHLGFRPSHIARSLRTRATHTVSLLVNDITNPFYSAVAKGVEEEANRHRYSLVLCNTNDDASRELQYLEVLRDRPVDGIIFGPTGSNVETIAQLARRIPLVMVDRRLPDVEADAVISDNEGGAYRAVRLLTDKGHQRIGLISWQTRISSMVQRFAGYRQALHDAGLSLDPSLILEVPRPITEQVRVHAAEWLLHNEHRPTALFALNNQIGLGTLSALKALGLCIPDDMALIVFDDLDVFELTTPPITAVDQPAFTMGQRAMQFLIDRMQRGSERLPEVTLLPTQLILRESV